MSDESPSAGTAAPIKCGQCGESMTVEQFFANDLHACITEPAMTIAEAVADAPAE